ncbi:hypothetical protein BC830DRAFT_672625 [Chytriomyces sp. MP71]|nr:hypothetical protein BC830DRAFT_672625 [Chytriomyces sp. MP71]
MAALDGTERDCGTLRLGGAVPEGYGQTNGAHSQQTTYCAYLVYSAFSSNDPATGNPCNPASLGNMPLCASSMAAFIASFQTIMSNKAFCPNGQNDAAKGYITAYQGIVNLGSPPSCAVGETAAEKANCGTPRFHTHQRNEITRAQLALTRLSFSWRSKRILCNYH